MKTNALSHNIFQYATKELSQDAFIAWLLSYACNDGKEKDQGLWSCAQSFLRSFVGKEDDSMFTVTAIMMQHDKIDVYVEMKDHNGNLYAVIVEDKVYSAHHDDQIYRYTEEVRKELNNLHSSHRGIEIHAVYFKTGHIQDSEQIEIARVTEKLQATGAFLHVIEIDDIIAILESATPNSEIFSLYKEYICHMKKDRTSSKYIAVSDYFYSKDTNNNPLNDAYTQWCFLDSIFPKRQMSVDDEMRRAFEKWKESHNYRGEQPIFAQDYMYSGSSSGTPWTQYCFWERAHDKDDIADENRPKHHSLFWRLDPWQISLRYYVNSGIKRPDEDEDLRFFKSMRPTLSGWTKVERHATYEFSLLEHKFSPEDKFEDLRAQILEIHRLFQKLK